MNIAFCTQRSNRKLWLAGERGCCDAAWIFPAFCSALPIRNISPPRKDDTWIGTFLKDCLAPSIPCDYFGYSATTNLRSQMRMPRHFHLSCDILGSRWKILSMKGGRPMKEAISTGSQPTIYRGPAWQVPARHRVFPFMVAETRSELARNYFEIEQFCTDRTTILLTSCGY